MIVFDLDGVLIDSKEAVIQAYGYAGAVAPENVFELEATFWLEAKHGAKKARKIRAQKNVEYIRLLTNGYMRELPPLRLARQLALSLDYTVGLLTGAPTGTIKAFANRYAIWPFSMAIDGLSTPRKMEELAALDEPGVYIDDQARLVDVPPGWRFIHYTGQDAETLLGEITCVCA